MYMISSTPCLWGYTDSKIEEAQARQVVGFAQAAGDKVFQRLFVDGFVHLLAISLQLRFSFFAQGGNPFSADVAARAGKQQVIKGIKVVLNGFGIGPLRPL